MMSTLHRKPLGAVIVGDFPINSMSFNEVNDNDKGDRNCTHQYGRRLIINPPFGGYFI